MRKVARGIVMASEAGRSSHEMGESGGVRTKGWFCVGLPKERTRLVVDHYADEFID